MERGTSLEEAKKIFGKGLIGPDELLRFSKQMGIKASAKKIPIIPYSPSELRKYSENYLLVLGTSTMSSGDPLSLLSLRAHFGVDPDVFEPCFYNQDWYLKENFMTDSLTDEWYMVRKSVFQNTRAQNPEQISAEFKLPSAVQCTYAFFMNFFSTSEYLWEHDFVWCNDKDHNGDRIYVGKYNDLTGLNKNGFSIHRHLTLRQWYGFIDTI
jgi:hypothetical protein